MRKQVFGRKFKRDINERKALFRSLMTSLVLQGQIKTTEAKAKAIKGDVEKLVTMGKTRGDNARRLITARVANEKVADKILSEIAPKFATRPGGYTRILRLGNRVKDNAPYVMLTWVEKISVTPAVEPKNNLTKTPKTAKTEVKTAKPAKKTAKTQPPLKASAGKKETK
ncbi:MAG TPA: 50S ribosomal protein L17 [Patescibacteria group bacterium]|nr:50S ribosomal protein L17 [Patescibacteria group bacterium]